MAAVAGMLKIAHCSSAMVTVVLALPVGGTVVSEVQAKELYTVMVADAGPPVGLPARTSREFSLGSARGMMLGSATVVEIRKRRDWVRVFEDG